MSGESWAARRAAETTLGLGTLLLSASTLVCCALPILLVSLGLGTAVAAATSAAPWLVALSAYKAWLFAGAGAAITAAAILRFLPGRDCPVDPHLAALCARADRWNRIALVVAAVIWVVGFVVAYGWLPLRRWLGT